MYNLLSVLSVLIIISTVPIVSAEVIRGESTVPDWIKNTAGWWASEQIPDSAFLQGIQYLIKEGIIVVEIPTEIDSEAAEEVPGWVKNTVGWWAEDKIHDTTFVSGIQYLISKGIMVVMEPQVEEDKCNFKGKEVVCSPFEKEVEEITDFYMEVNRGNCTTCLNWAYVGEKYYFQIETFGENHWNHIDGVTVTAKIISKGGDIRYNFGEVTTDDGIYKNNIIIPSMDWYAGNILSVTGTYYGVEKTIEKEFEVFKSKSKARTCSKISCYTINSVGSVSDSTNLNGVRGVETFTIGDSTYVVAAAQLSDKIVIFDISNPANPTSVGSLADVAGVGVRLNGPVELDIATIGGTPYAVVAAYTDKGIEIIDISDPTNPTSVGRLINSPSRELNAPYDVAITTIGDSTYAVVTAYDDDGVQIIDISDPTNPSATAYVSHCWGESCDGYTELNHPIDVEIATIGGSTYAVVAAGIDDGVQIIDISTPSSPSAVSTVEDDSTKELNGANGVAITTIGSSIYAVTTATDDYAISFVDSARCACATYVSELEDGTDTGVCTASNGERCLDGPRDVEIETINGLTYAIVASHLDDAITIIDITNVSNPSIVASMYNSSTKELDQAKGISIATIDGSTYVVVGSTTDDGIEIIQIMDRQI